MVFFYQVKKITWKEEKSRIMYRHIRLISMFRISIHRTWYEESNEHIFSNGKWSSQKLFLKWGFFLPSQKKSLGKRKKVELCTDTYDLYSCLEYQYVDFDVRNLMSIFLAMVNNPIKSYSWNEVFSYQVKKITWKKEKSRIMYRYIWLISMFRISIHRTWCEESNEHIFSYGKQCSRKLFLK